MNSALLIIDVQRGFFDPTPRPFEADQVVERSNQLSRRARAAGMPVIFLHHEDAADDMVPGTERWQLQRDLVREDSDAVVRKTTPDSFLRTDLGDLLSRANVKQLVICGYATEACIDSTTRRASALGYPVVLVADAHTTHDAKHASAALIRTHHNATLGSISFGPKIQVVSADQVVF